MKTLMIGGGGTGGHIYPAIAIAQEFLARGPNRKVVFVGTEQGLEKTIVPKAGFPLEFISVGGLKGKGGLELIRNVFRVPVGFLQALLENLVEVRERSRLHVLRQAQAQLDRAASRNS